MKYRKEFLNLIRQKKELSGLGDEIIEKFLPSLEDENYSSFTQFRRSKACKLAVSEVRKHLRDIYGLFINTPLTIRAIDSLDSQKLLELHKSTQERSNSYELVYTEIFKNLPEGPFTLFDVACGYNPLAYSFLPRKPSTYFACDLCQQDMELINYFFKKHAIIGHAVALDVLGTMFEEYISDKHFDVCFLFKALDPFEQVCRHSSKRLLERINATYFVVSFSLFSIGGKTSIPLSRRSWFEKFCKKKEWSYLTFQIPNEIFYIVKKE